MPLIYADKSCNTSPSNQTPVLSQYACKKNTNGKWALHLLCFLLLQYFQKTLWTWKNVRKMPDHCQICWTHSWTERSSSSTDFMISWVTSACSMTVQNLNDVVYYNQFSKHGCVYKESSFLDIGEGHNSHNTLISWNRRLLNMTHRNKFQKLLHVHIRVSPFPWTKIK